MGVHAHSSLEVRVGLAIACARYGMNGKIGALAPDRSGGRREICVPEICQSIAKSRSSNKSLDPLKEQLGRQGVSVKTVRLTLRRC